MKRKHFNRKRGLAVLGWAAALMAVAVWITWAARRTQANPGTEKRDVHSAAAATLEALRKNTGAPQDPAEIQEAAANLFVILNPDLAHREQRQDAAFVQAQAAAAASFSNPGAAHSKRMENPAFRRKYQEAMDAFIGEAKKAVVPIMPSATDARQIDALRNDSEWRRRREEPVQALLPAP